MAQNRYVMLCRVLVSLPQKVAMEYHNIQTPIRLREFGRGVQDLVAHALNTPDREKRTLLAHEIVRVMAILQPSVKEIPDYKHVLWDHLFRISEGKLEVESPYPMPSLEILAYKRPEAVPYPDADTLYKQYGHNIELMVAKAVDMPEGEAKTAYINHIASIMKLLLNEMKRESVPDSVIARHICEISRGKLVIDGDGIVIQKQMLQLRNVPVNEISTARKKKKYGKMPPVQQASNTSSSGAGKKPNNRWKKR